MPAAASSLERRIRRLTAAVLLASNSAFDAIDPAAIVAGWGAVAGGLAAQLAAAQIAAARAGDAYVPAELEQQGIDPAAVAQLAPGAFAVGSSGLPLDMVLAAVPLRALHIASTDGPPAGLAAARRLFEGIVETQVADAARQATSVRMVATPAVRGYVRMVEAGACSRCVVLAGRRYRWNSGFLRHPRCRCHHIPAAEDTADDRLTDPNAYFDSLTEAEQDKAFTRAGARAIRDGADINQVVNARRGALGLTPAGARITAAEARMLRGGRDVGRLQTTRIAGRDLYVTTEGTTRRGVAGKAMGQFATGRAPGERYTRSTRARLLPESIYAVARSREESLRLLRLYGYLL